MLCAEASKGSVARMVAAALLAGHSFHRFCVHVRAPINTNEQATDFYSPA
jgi:hypothetical protein